MIDSLIIKSEIYKNKENELIEKEKEIEELKKNIENCKRALNKKSKDIQELKNELEDEKNNLESIRKFSVIIKIFDELKKFNNKFISHSKLTRNNIMFHDKDRIYINKKYLENNFFNVYPIMDFKEKLHLLKLLTVIEVSEENRYTRKVFVEGKYKRMIVFNRDILKYYCNLCS